MSKPSIRGLGIPLNLNNIPTTNTNCIQLAASETYMIPPGAYLVSPGAYTLLQFLDPVTQVWKDVTPAVGGDYFVDADGGNFRLANLTGTPVGALITSGGSGSYTTLTNGVGTTVTGLTVTPSAGSSVWVPIVGGAVSATLTSGTVGVGYNWPPIVTVSAPPAGGLQATATTTLTSGRISVSGTNVTITNQGAGYTTPPTLTFTPDPREKTATTPGPTTTAVITTSLTGTGFLTGLYPSNNGSAVTTAPTFTFAPTGASATAIMNFVVTACSVSGTTGGEIGTGNAIIMTAGHVAPGANWITNPLHTTGITFPRPARISAPIASSTIASATMVIEDAGFGIQVSAATPVVLADFVVGSGGTSANTPNPTITFGGISDVTYLQPF